MSTKTKPALSREALHAALKPPNNCAVKRFRESLDEESLAVLDEALSYETQDFPAGKLREFLVAAGFAEEEVPGSDAIKDHRAGRRPCRCRG